MKSTVLRRIVRAVTATAIACVSVPALAHPGHEGTGGFMAGFWHPLSGLDHLAAMVGIGVLIAISGRRDGKRLATLALLAFLTGGFAGLSGFGSGLAEYVVLLSGLALVVVILLKERVMMAGIFVLTTAFSFAHGMVHAMEMPAQSSPGFYLAGFTASSAILVVLGLTISLRWQGFLQKLA